MRALFPILLITTPLCALAVAAAVRAMLDRPRRETIRKEEQKLRSEALNEVLREYHDRDDCADCARLDRQERQLENLETPEPEWETYDPPIKPEPKMKNNPND